ncbi:sorting nexin-25-like isoform X2 [Gigantopelta aegis]|uniref:sorting nexin-25-like isoform X2 n=1 Tax=Gigantopelta aegis TaxID=1735272 RepID=UPI001B88E28A|nr:sorting nexin-25-like isoform X2 [Gigantopelta aegis]
MESRLVQLSVGVGFLSLLYYWDYLSLFIYIIVHLLVIAVTFILVIQWNLLRGKSYRPSAPTNHANVANILLKKMMEKQCGPVEQSRKVIISRNLDNTIQEVLDLVIQDFIISWYRNLGKDQHALVTSVQSEIWQTIEELSKRLSKIDFVKVIAQDVVDHLHNHFRDIRLANKKNVENTETVSKFVLHSWLRDEAAEIDFLRTLCETLLLTLLPAPYRRCASIRHMLRDIITSAVIKPTINMLCDPDYLNQKLLNYLRYREKLLEDTKRTYTYAATYEDFVKKIGVCSDIEHLKQMRYSILSEIMHATTINNLKKAQGIKGDKESSPKGHSKGDLLKARNLNRYINQLTVAKSRCEKRIQALGGPDYKYYTPHDGDEAQSSSRLPGQMVLAFSVIMNDVPKARYCFMKFLKKDGDDSLLSFWNAVEKLKNASKEKRHQIASEIYQQFIGSSSTTIKFDRSLIRGMEVFLKGDKGPDSFYEAQKQIYSILEEKYYPSFLVSDVYHQYISQEEGDISDAVPGSSKDELFLESKDDFFDVDDEMGSGIFVEESYHAQQQLRQLDEKIANKQQALHALKSSHKEEDKQVKKVVEDMEQECMKLRDERRKLEGHITRTQLWIDNQGSWRTHVNSAEVQTDGDSKVSPSFIIVVFISGEGATHNVSDSTQGWVVSRTLDDFCALHEKLIQIGPWLKKKELPSVGINFFKSIDSAFLEKAKAILDEYLCAVMKDERMTQSEALYAFLTPTPEHLHQPSPQKKSKFLLVNLIKSLPTMRQTDVHDSEDEFLFLGDESTKEDISRDSIAKPLYRLMNEVFELRGMFKWLRKSFISFVEVTFGRSINKQLRDVVDWLFSESMLIYYIRTFKESMWPDGKLARHLPSRTDEEKLNTRLLAKAKVLQNVPDALKNLVGEDNAQRGTIKMFEALQDVRLNKHFIYNILQVFVLELVPELQKKTLNSKSSSSEEYTKS